MKIRESGDGDGVAVIEQGIHETIALHAVALEVAGLVVPASGRIRGVEHRLQLGIGEWPDRVEDRGAEPSEWFREALTALGYPASSSLGFTATRHQKNVHPSAHTSSTPANNNTSSR